MIFLRVSTGGKIIRSGTARCMEALCLSLCCIYIHGKEGSPVRPQGLPPMTPPAPKGTQPGEYGKPCSIDPVPITHIHITGHVGVCALTERVVRNNSQARRKQSKLPRRGG
jgi:hypothetical protein